jgi:hypothetical protein
VNNESDPQPFRNSYSSERWISQAEQRLDESHKEAVSRVMRDWTELETKYQDIKAQVINISACKYFRVKKVIV